MRTIFELIAAEWADEITPRERDRLRRYMRRIEAIDRFKKRLAIGAGEANRDRRRGRIQGDYTLSLRDKMRIVAGLQSQRARWMRRLATCSTAGEYRRLVRDLLRQVTMLVILMAADAGHDRNTQKRAQAKGRQSGETRSPAAAAKYAEFEKIKTLKRLNLESAPAVEAAVQILARDPAWDVRTDQRARIDNFLRQARRYRKKQPRA